MVSLSSTERKFGSCGLGVFERALNVVSIHRNCPACSGIFITSGLFLTVDGIHKEIFISAFKGHIRKACSNCVPNRHETRNK